VPLGRNFRDASLNMTCGNIVSLTRW